MISVLQTRFKAHSSLSAEKIDIALTFTSSHFDTPRQNSPTHRSQNDPMPRIVISILVHRLIMHMLDTVCAEFFMTLCPLSRSPQSQGTGKQCGALQEFLGPRLFPSK